MGSQSKRRARRTKREHRESTLPPGQAGRVLDRLLLLEKVIPRGEILQVLQDTGCLDGPWSSDRPEMKLVRTKVAICTRGKRRREDEQARLESLR